MISVRSATGIVSGAAFLAAADLDRADLVDRLDAVAMSAMVVPVRRTTLVVTGSGFRRSSESEKCDSGKGEGKDGSFHFGDEVSVVTGGRRAPSKSYSKESKKFLSPSPPP